MSAMMRRLGSALTWVLTIGSLIAVLVVGIGLARGFRPVVLTTGSMGETAPANSLVIVGPRPAADVAVGDILVMRNEGRATVTHRVIEIQRHDGTLFATNPG